MSFLDQHELAIDPVFIKRVEMALVKSSIFVVAESPSTDNHVNRTAYATEVLNDPERHAENMAKGVATNASITLESTDADIEFTVNSMFDAYAGKP